MCTYTVYSVVLVFRKHKSKTPLSEPSNNDAFPMAIPLTISPFWTTSPSLAVKGIKHKWCVFSSLELYKTPSQLSGLENKGNKIDLELCVCTWVHICAYVQVHMCIWINLWCHSWRFLYPVFETVCFGLTPLSGWLARKLWMISFLCLSSSGIASAHHCEHFSCEHWGLNSSVPACVACVY